MARAKGCAALMVVDNEPLQREAWDDLRRARKRLDRASQDLKRHEETDEPAFRAWLARSFPTLLSSVRELSQQVEARGRIVQLVQSEAFFTGRSPAAVWRAMQNPKAVDAPPPPNDEGWDAEEEMSEEARRFFERTGIDPNDPFAKEFGLSGAETPKTDPRDGDARAIYRRLVQHLHPDRGGEWTEARARVWDQVQEAWQSADADWLARLEAEWEASADLLTPTSALGRLRAALREIFAACRDAERRVRTYRKQPAWRFSLAEPSESKRVTMEQQLREQEESLRYELEAIEEAIASWQKPRRRKGGRRSSFSAAWHDDMPLY
jgi:hypothetical protein